MSDAQQKKAAIEIVAVRPRHFVYRAIGDEGNCLRCQQQIQPGQSFVRLKRRRKPLCLPCLESGRPAGVSELRSAS
jgi:hypothetical protein